ncbi:UPF0489 protein C5orf22-like [Exaiptasia diaphana]|nr:UPF0489 protein C5orf22-like [Exaiptasia diaphana]
MKELNKCILERSSQLESIESTIKYAENLEKVPDSTPDSESKVNQQLLQVIQDIRSSSDGEKPDCELIHSAGMTIDLPHHISTKQEIDNLLNMLYFTMFSLPKPTLVTMARSTYDEYTPPHQIDYIQNSLVKILGVMYGQDFIDVHLDY